MSTASDDVVADLRVAVAQLRECYLPLVTALREGRDRLSATIALERLAGVEDKLVAILFDIDESAKATATQ